MPRSYLPSLLARDDDPFGSLFREVQKTFEDFSRRPPLAGFGSDVMAPRIDTSADHMIGHTRIVSGKVHRSEDHCACCRAHLQCL
jgi:hypothetical protein